MYFYLGGFSPLLLHIFNARRLPQLGHRMLTIVRFFPRYHTISKRRVNTANYIYIYIYIYIY